MAYKDEYEVARLYTDGEFLAQLAETFDGEKLKLKFHLAPPILGRKDPVTGKPRKSTFGPWAMPLFRVLARLKGLRGTRFDPFGYTRERRAERQLIGDYIALVERLSPTLSPENYAAAAELAALPSRYTASAMKERNIEAVKAEEAALLTVSTCPGRLPHRRRSSVRSGPATAPDAGKALDQQVLAPGGATGRFLCTSVDLLPEGARACRSAERQAMCQTRKCP